MKLQEKNITASIQ